MHNSARYLPKRPTASYWLKDLKMPVADPLPSRTVDAAIIGAGITGLSVARRLQELKPEWQIAVIEGRQLCGGATGRNGGLLIPGLQDGWTSTAARVGEAQTRKLFRFDLQNAVALSQFVSSYISNGGEPDPFLHSFKDGCLNAFATEAQRDFWTAEVEKMQDAGACGEGMFTILDRKQVAGMLGTDKFCGAVQIKPGFRVWGARLVLALAQDVLAKNKSPSPGKAGGRVNFCTETLVRKVEFASESGGSWTSPPLHRIITDREGDGPGTLTARNVVFCTNSHTRTLLPDIPIVPVKNQVIVTQPISPFPAFDGCVSANDGYEYFSAREDGRLVLGGMRNLAPDMAIGNGDDASLDPVISTALRSYIHDTFPHIRDKVEIEMEWAGIMGFSADRLPFVGPVGEDRPGVFVCAGYTGHGMPRAFLSGYHTAEMVAGVKVGEDFPEILLPHGRLGKAERVPIDTFKSLS
ncbi:FAD dependent oxidoreductase [Powellomyces hirtus]|nr:FAD dependent oxidoreductase [Powellomyces hirtus]